MSQTAAQLTTCLNTANGNPSKVKTCETTFTNSGGTEAPGANGGKVFTDSAGGKVFVTAGGKVFSPPE